MSFVVTAGQLQAIHQVPTYGVAYPGRGVLSLSSTMTTSYEELWRTQPALRTVAGFLARNVAQLSVDPYRRVSSTDREKATDHPLAAILRRPMYGTPWTKYRLLNTLMHDLCVYDTAYWLKVKTDDDIRGILPIPPRMMTPQGANPFAPTSFLFTGNVGRRDIPADELGHFHGYNPDDPRTGVAPVETLRQILAEEHAASTYRSQMWRNGARIAGYIARPTTAPRWSDDAHRRFKADWLAQYAGDGPQSGGTPILEDGMTFVGASVTPKDAQYVEARKLTREEVAVAFHVSPVMLGMMEGATFSNVTELHKMLYQDTLAPWLVQIQQDIENQLLDDLDPLARDGSVYVEFNLKGKLSGSFEEQSSALQSAVGGPWMTRDEARGMNNLPHIDGADELIVPLNVITGGLASPNDTAPNNPDNGPSNGQPPKDIGRLLRKFFTRQAAVVLSRLASGGADVDAVLDVDRWNRELAADLAAVGASLPVTAINADTRGQLAEALHADDPVVAAGDLFRTYVEERSQVLARP